MDTLDLTFLDVSLPPASGPKQPVNVYDILRDGWRETRVDMTLQFFLDPNERHGLGPLAMDALLRTLQGAHLIDAGGITGESFDPGHFLGSNRWELGTQVEYIDVLAVNEELDLALVLENKVGHVLNNPLQNYAQSALSNGVSQALVVVLAPELREAPTGHERWLSASITYDRFNAEIRRSPALINYLLAPADLDQRRSLDLLQQFFEARSGGPTMTDLTNEEERLSQWRDLMQSKQEALKTFERAQTDIRRLLKVRNTRLEPLIAEKLADLGMTPDWEAHGGSGEDVWNAYHFPEIGWSIELKFTIKPELPKIYVQLYPARDYKLKQIEDLGLPWSSSDEELVEAFIHRLQRLASDVVKKF